MRGVDAHEEAWATTDAALTAYEELLATLNLEDPPAVALVHANEAEIKRRLREQVWYEWQDREH